MLGGLVRPRNPWRDASESDIRDLILFGLVEKP